MQSVDIAIVGGGMVGAALAASLLQQTELCVAVIDSQRPLLSWPEQDYPVRVSAINRASQQLLASLGVWDSIVSSGTGCYERMQVWDAKSGGAITLSAAEVAASELGYIVDNRVIQKALWQSLAQYGARCLRLSPEAGEGIERQAEGWQLRLQSGATLSARLLVGADGVQSWLRQSLAIACDRNSYGQKAIVCAVKTAVEHQATAWQRFLPTGPLAFLPLKDPHVSSIVWSVKEDKAAALLALSDEAFCQALAEAFDHTLGAVSLLSPRVEFPLAYHHASTYVADQAVLIGDAAHGIHPLAGQGVNLGFADVRALSEVIGEAIRRKRPWYTDSVLQRYQRLRRADNALTLEAMNGLNALFSNESAEWALIRGLGLSSVDKLEWMKRFFIRHAMGQ